MDGYYEVSNLSRDFDWLAGLFFCLILKIFSLLLIYLSEYKKIDKIIHLQRMFSQYLLIYVNTLKGKLVT